MSDPPAVPGLRVTLAVEGVLLLAFAVLALSVPGLGVAGVAVTLGIALAAGGLPTAVATFRAWPHPGRGHFWRALLGVALGFNLAVNLTWRAAFLHYGLVMALILATGLFAAGWFYRGSAAGTRRHDWITIAMGGAMLQLALAGLIFEDDLRYLLYAQLFGVGAALYGTMLLVSAARLAPAKNPQIGN